MAGDDARDAVRAELRSVEEQLAELRRTAAQIRREIGEREDGAVDPEDLAATLTSVQEQEALVGALETRRESLLRRLGEEPEPPR
jgi:hypothetical protein